MFVNRFQALNEALSRAYPHPMDRRAFLALVLAGAADTGQSTMSPMPPAKPAALGAPELGSGDPAFDAWVRDFMVASIAAGLPAEVLVREFTGLSPDPQVLALDGRQPEFSKPVGDYVRGVVNDARVAEGQKRRAALAWLPQVEARYGVPGEILISIWAVETARRHPGRF